ALTWMTWPQSAVSVSGSSGISEIRAAAAAAPASRNSATVAMIRCSSATTTAYRWTRGGGNPGDMGNIRTQSILLRQLCRLRNHIFITDYSLTKAKSSHRMRPNPDFRNFSGTTIFALDESGGGNMKRYLFGIALT